MMINYRFLLPLSLILCSCFSFLVEATEDSTAPMAKPAVLVTITPYRYIVDRIAGETIDLIVMVPPGADPHSYEPRPKQVLAMSEASLWLRAGDPAEAVPLAAIRKYNPNMRIVDLRKGLELIYGKPCCSHHHEDPGSHNHGNETFDPHIWLSARMIKQQAELMLTALIDLQPTYETQYITAFQQLVKDLEAADEEMTQILAPFKGKSILVAHPSFGYLCRDYGLIQLAIEFGGKDPGPKQLLETVSQARSLGIHTIFIQKEYNRRGAEAIAKEIGATIIELDPFSENFIENIIATARAFADSFGGS